MSGVLGDGTLLVPLHASQRFRFVIVDVQVVSYASKRRLGALLFATTYSDPTDSNRQLRDEGFEFILWSAPTELSSDAHSCRFTASPHPRVFIVPAPQLFICL